MNQEDFRRLVSSGGGAGAGAGGSSYGGKRQLTDADLAEIKKLSKRPKKKSKKPANSKGDADEGDAAAASVAAAEAHARYRDRAAERRKGVERGDMADADEFAHLDVEQSKFLGGDMEHTHLVKGLDFALLAQLKREKEKLQKATADAEHSQPTSSTTTSSSSGCKPAGKLTFASRMGRLVYFHACQSNAAAAFGGGGRRPTAKSELFLPGRMDYTFNLSELEAESIPVSVQRSKEDCPEPDEVVSGMVDEELVDRIGELLRHSVPGKKMRRKKRDHEHQAAVAASEVEDDGAGGQSPAADEDKTQGNKAEVDDDDENIFSDVGDYVPVDQRESEEPSAAEKAAVKATGYFANLSASISATEAAARKKEKEEEDAWTTTLKKAVDAQVRKEQEEVRRAKAEKLAAMTSGHDEYFGEYQAAGALDDSDDEDAADDGKKKRKAAAVSGGDGDGEIDEEERSRRKQQKHSNKLQNDLEKINQIMEKKSGK